MSRKDMDPQHGVHTRTKNTFKTKIGYGTPFFMMCKVQDFKKQFIRSREKLPHLFNLQ